jgi:transposase
MLTYTPQQKHIILTHYRAGDRSASLRALARRFAVQGGNAVILRWYQRWDGTPQSLETRKRSGRPRVLSKREVQQHVHAPLLRANRAHKQMHYSKLVPSVQEKTAKEVSARTVRRYGKEELGARKGRGKKRTAEESECTHA